MARGSLLGCLMPLLSEMLSSIRVGENVGAIEPQILSSQVRDELCTAAFSSTGANVPPHTPCSEPTLQRIQCEKFLQTEHSVQQDNNVSFCTSLPVRNPSNQRGVPEPLSPEQLASVSIS